jgi:CHAT domain-containing protein
LQESHQDKLEKENLRVLELYVTRLEEVKSSLQDQMCPLLLKELYAALITPVEGALEGALEGVEELLIVPHKELSEVLWAALTDADGRYLIERHVIRTTPSLRVARQAADKMQTSGHIVLVGNPLPIPKRFPSLNFADKEVESIYKILNGVAWGPGDRLARSRHTSRQCGSRQRLGPLDARGAGQ